MRYQVCDKGRNRPATHRVSVADFVQRLPIDQTLQSANVKLVIVVCWPVDPTVGCGDFPVSANILSTRAVRELVVTLRSGSTACLNGCSSAL